MNSSLTARQIAARQKWLAELYARARDTYDCGRLDWSERSRNELFEQAAIRQDAAARAAVIVGSVR